MTVRLSKTAIFSTFSLYFFRSFRGKANIIIQALPSTGVTLYCRVTLNENSNNDMFDNLHYILRTALFANYFTCLKFIPQSLFMTVPCLLHWSSTLFVIIRVRSKNFLVYFDRWIRFHALGYSMINCLFYIAVSRGLLNEIACGFLVFFFSFYHSYRQ